MCRGHPVRMHGPCQEPRSSTPWRYFASNVVCGDRASMWPEKAGGLSSMLQQKMQHMTQRPTRFGIARACATGSCGSCRVVPQPCPFGIPRTAWLRGWRAPRPSPRDRDPEARDRPGRVSALARGPDAGAWGRRRVASDSRGLGPRCPGGPTGGWSGPRRPQQLDLQWKGHVADLVEEQGAPLGDLEAPGLVSDCAHERSPRVTEQLALEERFGQSAAVDHYAGPC